jgi:hypothetical protein
VSTEISVWLAQTKYADRLSTRAHLAILTPWNGPRYQYLRVQAKHAFFLHRPEENKHSKESALFAATIKHTHTLTKITNKHPYKIKKQKNAHTKKETNKNSQTTLDHKTQAC